MRRRVLAVLLATVAGLGITGRGAPADAQPRRGPNGEPGAPEAPLERPERRDRKAERRAQVKKKIRAMRAYTLTEELSLDEATAGRLFPVLARFDEETDRLLERRVDLQRRLRRVDPTRDPRAIDRTIDEAVANQRSFAELEDRRIADLRKILTPVQTARLLVVLPVLERRIETQLRNAIVGPTSSTPRSRPGGRLRHRDAAAHHVRRTPRRAPAVGRRPRAIRSACPGPRRRAPRYDHAE